MISIINAVFKDIWGFFMPPNTKKKLVRVAILVVLIFAGTSFLSEKDEETPDVASLPPTVFVGTVADVQNGDALSFVGTVRAVSEAQIQSEVSGRVTAVFAKPGDVVRAGTILATLENASQKATLLQAEGAYEAALAGAAQSEVSVEDAQNTVINTYRSAYSTAYSVVLNSVDVFFSDPNSRLVPGVRISTGGQTTYLNNTRKDLNTIFDSWREKVNTVTTSSDLSTLINQAQGDTAKIIDMVDVLIAATSDADADDQLEGELVTSYTADLTAARSSLNAVLSSLSSAEENLNRAYISGTQNTDVSLANAQVKQALGALRSAEANFEKTVFRSPISGTVNSLQINVGDFVSAFTQVAEVANNDALEISIFAGEADLDTFSLGDEVRINDSVQGTVTSIAPAVDPLTQKTEIKIATESDELVNGSTVTVEIEASEKLSVESSFKLPITAIKFTAEDGFIFILENNELVASPITIGDIHGSLVTVTDGIDENTVFVLDARGLAPGQKVEAIRK